jgi:cytochrome c-type biogenesis protein CcmH/NrfG
MGSSFAVLALAAVITAAAAFWALRAYRRGGGANARMALALCAAVGVAALGTYLALGRPDLADAPYRARLDALRDRDPTTFNADEALAVLHEAARENPNDPLPHFFTGELLYRLDRPDEAARAYDQALRRDPDSGEAMLGLGRALVAVENGRVSPEALDLFQRASATVDDPAPWMYQAMAAMQSGADATPFWREALARASDEDPRRAMLQRMASGEALESMETP